MSEKQARALRRGAPYTNRNNLSFLRKNGGRLPLSNRKPGHCQERNCSMPGNPCFLPDLDGSGQDTDVSYWYCSTHARKNGFYPGCGQFWAGVESFDFSPTGYCENCRTCFEDDDYEDDEYDYDLPDEAYAEYDEVSA